MQVELELTFLLSFSRKLFFIKNDVKTFFFSENRLQNRGAHYTQVNTVYIYTALHYALLALLSLSTLVFRNNMCHCLSV